MPPSRLTASREGLRVHVPCNVRRPGGIAVALAIPIPPGFAQFLPFVLIVVVFYFMLIRPNQQKQKKWQEMLGNLKPGDRITTTGGMRGTIFALRDDVIQLRVPPDNIKIEVVKSAIASVTTPEESK